MYFSIFGYECDYNHMFWFEVQIKWINKRYKVLVDNHWLIRPDRIYIYISSSSLSCKSLSIYLLGISFIVWCNFFYLSGSIRGVDWRYSFRLEGISPSGYIPLTYTLHLYEYTMIWKNTSVSILFSQKWV